MGKSITPWRRNHHLWSSWKIGTQSATITNHYSQSATINIHIWTQSLFTSKTTRQPQYCTPSTMFIVGKSNLDIIKLGYIYWGTLPASHLLQNRELLQKLSLVFSLDLLDQKIGTDWAKILIEPTTDIGALQALSFLCLQLILLFLLHHVLFIWLTCITISPIITAISIN